MLLDVYSASLECTPAHFSAEGKVTEATVSGKLAIFIPHQVLEVISHSHGSLSWSQEVSINGGLQAWESAGVVTFSNELVDGYIASWRPFNWISWFWCLPFITDISDFFLCSDLFWTLIVTNDPRSSQLPSLSSGFWKSSCKFLYNSKTGEVSINGKLTQFIRAEFNVTVVLVVLLKPQHSMQHHRASHPKVFCGCYQSRPSSLSLYLGFLRRLVAKEERSWGKLMTCRLVSILAMREPLDGHERHHCED